MKPDEAGSDLREVRDLRARQFDEIQGTQLDVDASAPARDDHEAAHENEPVLCLVVTV